MAEVRTMVRQALEKEGGVEYLRWAARKKPAAFLSLLGRLLPAEIRASLDHDGLPTVILRNYCGVEFEQLRPGEAEPRQLLEEPIVDTNVSEATARPNGGSS